METALHAVTDTYPRATINRLILLNFSAILLMGLGWIALLPPFAAVDEALHYSRIEAAAFAPPTGRSDFISADVIACTYNGPMPFRWIVAEAFNEAFNDRLEHGGPMKFRKKMQQQAHKDYHDFFKQEPAAVEKYRQLCGVDAGHPVFVASPYENEEYQHPALYYLLLGRILRLMPAAPLMTRLFLLRVASYLLAFMGLALGFFVTRRHLRIRGEEGFSKITLLATFYPFLMPAFFQEFCRVGNDSLCLFLFSLSWALTLLYLRQPRETTIWCALGIVTGYGWLTKATMIPVSIGLLLFMALYPRAIDKERSKALRFLVRIPPSLTAATIGAAIGLAPYIGAGKAHRSGSAEFEAWSHGRGFIHDDAGIPWLKILQNQVHMVNAFVYDLTEIVPSLSIQPFNFLLTLVLALILAAWTVSLPKDPRREEWLPLFPLLPLAAGYALWGTIASVAYRVTGMVPGQELHVLAPALALICGKGLSFWTRHPVGQISLRLLLPGALAVLASIILLRLALFSGCARQSGSAPYFSFDSQGCSLNSFYDRLAVLGWPQAGLACIALALIFLTVSSSLVLRYLSWRPKTSLAD